MKIAILEDEAPARERLEQALRRVAPEAEVVGAFASVEQTCAWLAANPAPDLALADIQLSDGLSFEVFEKVACPVVFCTAYDEYVVHAMAAGGIDYLVKPIKDAELAVALGRYRKLEAHFKERLRGVARAIAAPPKRLLVRKRDGFATVAIDQVAYFVVDDKLVDVVTRDGRRFGLDRTLGELEAELAAGEFFRLNRQYLVAASSIAGFKPWTKGKLLVELAPAPSGEVVVSQENAARFRAWLRG